MELPHAEAAPGDAESRPLDRAAWLRAGAVTLGLLVVGLSALPSRPYDLEKLERATHRRSVDRVVAVLTAIGIRVDGAEVGDALIAVSEPLIGFRNAVVTPLRPLFDFMGMGQRWGLFLQSGRTAYRIEVEGRAREGGWTLLYRPHQHDPFGLESTLAFRRLRGLYNPGVRGEPRPQFEGFVGFLASRIFAEHAEIEAVRVRMERIRLGTFDEPSLILDVAHASERTRGGGPS